MPLWHSSGAGAKPMHFRIADTFTDSLARLTGDEQKAAKTTAFDLQLNPTHPGHSFHRLDKARDKNFWSVRVSRDIRLIVHRSVESVLLCYVDHHDKAYDWAQRRTLETHPTTGAAQLVEIRETMKEIVVPVHSTAAPPETTTRPCFPGISDDELLNLGVPTEWLADVRSATEDSLLVVADHLPTEAAEALLELATGGRPIATKVPPPAMSPFDHPDAQRRFRVMKDLEELERALAYPWDKWTVFLHPAQRELVERDYAGPARVSGSAGTGKTIVALHRAVFLARRRSDSRVLLTTFSEPLANALRARLRRLISNEPRLAERLELHALDAVGERLYEAHFGTPRIPTPEVMESAVAEAQAAVPDRKFRLAFVQGEWDQLVDAWQLASWDEYRDIQRLGRKTRLSEKQRQVLWSVFEGVRQRLQAAGYITRAAMLRKVESVLAERRTPPFDYVVVDEAQDVGVAQLRFLAALGGTRQNGLFFAGDLGQRIFQLPFSWKSLGVDVRGRSRTLHVNYRTSHQIRAQADRLLGAEIADVDGVVESRRGTVSVFNGPPPIIRAFNDSEAEIAGVAEWLRELTKDGVAPHEIGVFVRSEAELPRATAALSKAGVPSKMLDAALETTSGFAAVGTMHLAKGLEFRAVSVMACDDEIVPLQSRIEAVSDNADLEDVYNTERHLLYVACTRARDQLLVTCVEPASEFLDDLRSSPR